MSLDIEDPANEIDHALLEPWDWDTSVEGEKTALLQIRVPARWIAQIRAMTHEGIAKGTRPWKNPTDCARSLLLRGLRGISYEIGNIKQWMKERDIEVRHRYIHERITQAKTNYETTKLQVQEMFAIGAPDHAALLVRQDIKAIEEMDPSLWNDWLLEKLQTEFHDLLESYPERGVALGKGRA